MSTQLALFSAGRYHDPRVAAERARARSLAKLRPLRRAERNAGATAGVVVSLRGPISLRLGEAGGVRRAA